MHLLIKVSQVIARLFVLTLLFAGVTCLPNTASAAAASPYWTTSEAISYGSGTAKFTAIRVDLSNPNIQVVSAIAGDKIGQTAALAEIVAGETDADGTGVAGINGTFFNAYTDFQPTGTVIRNGEVQHISNAGSVLGVTGSGEIRIDAMYTRIIGGTLDQWVWPYAWEAWNINHWYADDKATMLFDATYAGPKPAHAFTSIEVTDGVVTKVGQGGFTIPANGYLILTKDATLIAKFPVGRTAEYDFKYLANNYNPNQVTQQPEIGWEDVKSALGAGPVLVKNGVVVVDPAREHFTEPKILTNKGQRSLVGVTAGRQLVMASVPSVSVAELAVVAKNMGLVNAINFDGGGSSTTWIANAGVTANGTSAAGRYVSPPGRKISNALVVRLMKDKPVHVSLNGRELFFDADPYRNSQYGRVLVPLRKIAVSLGATVSFDAASQAIVISKGSTSARLRTNDRNAVINGAASVLELPVITRNGRAYVPARFLGDLLGAAVGWDGASNTVTLTMANQEAKISEGLALEAAGRFEDAATAFESILVTEPANLTIMKRLVSIYHAKLSRYVDAVRIYRMILTLEPENLTVMTSYAWALYASGDYAGTVVLIQGMVDKGQANATHYGILGAIYSSFSWKDPVKAKQYYQLVLTSNPSAAEKAAAEKWLAAN